MNYNKMCLIIFLYQGYAIASFKLPVISEKFKTQQHDPQLVSAARVQKNFSGHVSPDLTGTESDITSELSMTTDLSNATFDSPQTAHSSLVSYKSNQTSKFFTGLVQRDLVQGSVKMVDDGIVLADSLDAIQETPLHNAARFNSYNTIRVLVKKNRINIDQKNRQGQTALCIAVKQRAYDSLLQLIELDADLNAQDIIGRTALHWACDRDEFPSKQRNKIADDMVRVLVSVDRSPVLTGKQDKIMDFKYQNPHTYTNLDIQDHEGNVPLHIAVASQRYIALQELADTGAMLDVQNKLGQTPLHVAVMHNDVRAVKILLLAGADARVIDNEGKTPCQYATRQEIEILFT